MSGIIGQIGDHGNYREFMLKEIHEQPRAIADTLAGRVSGTRLLERCFGPEAGAIFDKVRSVQIIGCGSSYHAGLVARHWFESLAHIPCRVEVASEFRCRRPIPDPNTLIIAISQSGETADTVATVQAVQQGGFGPTLAIVNVADSALNRAADLVLQTRAGPELGVAATKAFTTQLTALILTVIALGRRNGLTRDQEAELVDQLQGVAAYCRDILSLETTIRSWATRLMDKRFVLFLGRGCQYPIALEGALKFKEIASIHAQAYAAGELKHGPLALVEKDIPVVALAPKDALLEKLKSNLQEVRARGGEFFVVADENAGFQAEDRTHVLSLPAAPLAVQPIVYSLPQQLLAYHVAILKGTDGDNSRNLARPVTVELQ